VRKAMTDFVSVPVPLDRVQEVYELLARRSVTPMAGSVATEDGYEEGWNQTLLDRMFLESSGAMRQILHVIAERSPAWVTTTEIAEASGLTARQVVASFGPFKKRVRGRYGLSRWPFQTREFVDAGVYKYCMLVATASRIIALTSEVEMHEKGAM
jgi:hypothetical protein